MTVQNTSLDRRARFETWPDIDRALWIAGCKRGDVFEKSGAGSELAPATLSLTARAYRALLDFLRANQWLDPATSPAERVTRDRLILFLQALKADGKADWTIIGRLEGIRRAIRIMSPSVDTAWMRRPCGVSLYAMLPKATRSLFVPDSGTLYAWALELMDSVPQGATEATELCRFRNGLLFAMLASRGRRLRSMALLRLDREIIRMDLVYRIELAPHQVKTKKRDRFTLPAVLTPYVERYISSIRPLLLGQHSEDGFWINIHGRRMTEKHIQYVTLAMTKQRFGVAFGPHRFRHAIATTAALRGYAMPGLAAGVLGISAGVIEQNYNRAGQAEAAANYNALLEARLRSLPSLEQLGENALAGPDL